jgi:ABC-type multidrug transport system fused ATPase/permease subunit
MTEEKATARSEFEAIFEREDSNHKVTLLEKHLLESREEFNRLKAEELELRKKQAELVERMQESLEKTRKVDEILAQSISDKIEGIKTEMFDEWKESVKDSMIQAVSELAGQKIQEYQKIYEDQNRVIENQAKKFKNIIESTRIMRFMCYTICFVSTLVLIFIPIATYLAKDIMAFLEDPSLWGGVVLFVAVFLMFLAIGLAILLRGKAPKE